MSNKIIEIVEKIPKVSELPDGLYAGTWGGYSIDVRVKDKEYRMKTEEGIRGFGIKVVVEIKEGIATFTELKN